MLQITISKRAAFIALVAVLLVVPVVAFAGVVFNDVDDGSTHIEGITFMKSSGVSVGCDTNNNYCPSDDVTRAQMGTFMYRLSGNDPATAPSVNADMLDGLDSTDFLGASATAVNSDKVDGYDANSLVRFASGTVVDNALVNVDGTATTATMTAPVSGYLMISASSDVYITAGNDPLVTCTITVNGTEMLASQRTIELDAATNGEENCSTDARWTALFPGDYVVNFDYSSVGAATVVDETVLNVLFVPFGPTGTPPQIFIP